VHTLVAKAGVLLGIGGGNIVMRKIVISLTAAAAIMAASAFGADARAGMGGMGHGGMGMGGMGHGGMGGGTGHAMVGHPGGVGGFSGVRSSAFHGDHFGRGDRFGLRGERFDRGERFGFRDHRFGFRHRFGRDRFLFAFGLPYAYGYDDGCYVRVWTRWGWHWRSVCY
jgi:hypothetical protein